MDETTLAAKFAAILSWAPSACEKKSLPTVS
jgi:hypothetical protein